MCLREREKREWGSLLKKKITLDAVFHDVPELDFIILVDREQHVLLELVNGVPDAGGGKALLLDGENGLKLESVDDYIALYCLHVAIVDFYDVELAHRHVLGN